MPLRGSGYGLTVPGSSREGWSSVADVLWLSYQESVRIQNDSAVCVHLFLLEQGDTSCFARFQARDSHAVVAPEKGTTAAELILPARCMQLVESTRLYETI